MRFQNILAYAALHDEAGTAIRHAGVLAVEHGARLRVVRVLEPTPFRTRFKRASGSSEDVQELLERCQREIIESEVQALRDERIEVDVDLLWGTPWLEVTRKAIEHGHDLVVKAAEGSDAPRGLRFGSTALHLIRKCPCPVWIVGAEPPREGRRVLAAVDPDVGEVRREVASRVLELAASIAGPDGAFTIGTAWLAAGEMLLRGHMKPDELAEYVESARHEVSSDLDEVLAAHRDLTDAADVRLIRGLPKDVIARLVATNDITHLVMGSVGRTGIAGLLIGETAESLARSVACSVIVVKPPGFRSPVELEDRASD